MMKRVGILLGVLAIVFGSACKKTKPEEETDPGISFDQKGMFENYSANLIVPAYQLLRVKIDSLENKILSFNTSTNTTNLTLVKNAFMDAYKQYMHVSTYEFGPAASYIFRASTNIFPTDTTQINTNISTGGYDLNSAAQTDAIGFPAIDFLLYGKNKTETSIVNLFATNANRRQYLLDVCLNIKTRLNNIISGWSSYATTFNTATGNSAGSSLSNLVNELNYDYEITKNARVGIPLGKQTLGVALPEKCEAYFSSNSLVLLAEHVNALEDIYLGKSQTGTNGIGLDDYLETIGAQYAGGSLNAAIQAKFSELKTLIALVPGPLSTAVTANPTPVENVYSKLQELLVLLKTDLPSALSVYITYVDGDGD